MLICLLVHPVVLEAAEAMTRALAGDGVADKLRRGEITLKVAEAQIVQSSLQTFGTKQLHVSLLTRPPHPSHT